MRLVAARHILPWSTGKAALSGRLMVGWESVVASHLPYPQLQWLVVSAWRCGAFRPTVSPKGLSHVAAGPISPAARSLHADPGVRQ